MFETTPFSPLKLLAHYERIVKILSGEIPFPAVVEVFPSRACPHACPYCRCRAFRGTLPPFIDGAFLRGFLEECISVGVRALELSGGGEPLVHPEIVGILETASDLGLEVGLITNGHRLGEEEVAAAVASFCRWCRVALDAATPETYERIHGPALPFEALCRAIRSLAGRRRGPKRLLLGVKFLISRLNLREIRAAARLAAELGADYIQFKPARNHPLEIDESQAVRGEEEIEKARAELKSQDFAVMGSARRTQLDRACMLTPLHPVVDTDGRAYLCPFFEHRQEEHLIGHIGGNNFFQTQWGSSRHKQAIRSIDLAKCQVYDCPARSYHAFVDRYIREDPLCVWFP
jgi:MoaA/NifB/PqqE/SkfB family radical SAM enzyme